MSLFHKKLQLKHDSNIFDFKYADVDRLVSSTWMGSIKMWNTKTGECLRTLNTNATYLYVLTNNRLVSAERINNQFTIWNLDTFEHRIIGTRGNVKAFEVLESGQLVCAEMRSRISDMFVNITFWQLDGMHASNLATIESAHDRCIICLQALPGNRLASASVDCLIKIWSANREVLRVINEQNYGVAFVKVKISPLSSSHLITVSNQALIKVWNYENGECVSIFDKNSVMQYVFFVNSDLLAAKQSDSSLCIYEMKGFECLLSIPMSMIHERHIECRWQNMVLVSEQCFASACFDEIIIFGFGPK